MRAPPNVHWPKPKCRASETDPTFASYPWEFKTVNSIGYIALGNLTPTEYLTGPRSYLAPAGDQASQRVTLCLGCRSQWLQADHSLTTQRARRYQEAIESQLCRVKTKIFVGDPLQIPV